MKIHIAREGILAAAVREELEKEIIVTDETLQKHLDEHVSQYEEARVKRIVIRSKSSMPFDPAKPADSFPSDEEAQAKADEEQHRRDEEQAKRAAEGRKRRGKEPAPVDPTPADKAQTNFTDPEAKIMKQSNKGFDYSYNAQAVVDGAEQIIVAAEVTPTLTKFESLGSM